MGGFDDFMFNESIGGGAFKGVVDTAGDTYAAANTKLPGFTGVVDTAGDTAAAANTKSGTNTNAAASMFG